MYASLLTFSLLYKIKQIDSLSPCVCSVNESQKTSKCDKNSDTLV